MRVEELGIDLELRLVWNGVYEMPVKINNVAWEDLPVLEKKVPERKLALRHQFQKTGL